MAISVLFVARRRVEQQSTANRHALNAVMRQLNLGFDARKGLSGKQVIEISNWRIREHDTIKQRIARGEAVDLAKAIEISQNRMKVIRENLSHGMSTWRQACKIRSVWVQSPWESS